MKDEVLQKALSTDATVIPRYDVVKPDGSKVAENVQLVLKNKVLTAGTPLNKQNLLSDDAARAYGLDPTTATPDVVLRTVRNSVSYCPKVRINLLAGSVAYVKNTTSNVTQTYTVPEVGYVIADLLAYGTYSIWGEYQGVTTTAETMIVDTTKLYTIDVDYYTCIWKFTVEAEVGATITVRHSDGLTLTGTVGSDKTCLIPLPKMGMYTAVGSYDGCNSLTYYATAVSASEGQIVATTAMKWVTATISVTTGAIVTLVQGSYTRGGTAVNGTLKVWLPYIGTWSVTATLGSDVTTGSIEASDYINYSLALTFYVTYGVRIPLGNSSPTAAEYTDNAVGMLTGYTAWSNQKIFKDIKPCVIKKGVVQYYLNKTNLAQKVDGTAVDTSSASIGEVVVEVPRIGYRIYSDSSYLYVKITDKPSDPDFCYLAHSLDNINDCDKIYYGAFLGYHASALYSISGRPPKVAYSIENFRIAVSNNGAGYQLMSFYPWTLLQCLYLIMYKNLNGQEAIGAGYNSYTSGTAPINTGGTIAKGPCYGEPTGSSQMCFLNIEDFWGNASQWIDGIFVNSSYQVLTAYKDFNSTGANYPYSTPSGFSQSYQGYMAKVLGNNNAGFIMSERNGSATTYYCDYGNVSGNAMCIAGGSYKDSLATLGPFCHNITNQAASTPGYTGARLMYKHKEA